MLKRPALILTLLLICTVMVSALAHLSGPRVLSAELLPITSQRQEEQLQVRFSRPMKTDGFEEFWSLEPNIPGRFNWSDGVLYFTPEETLPAGEEMVIRIGAGAQDIYGRRLGKDRTMRLLPTPEPSFVYLNADGQLTYGSVSGEQKVLTKGRTVRQFVIDGKNQLVWYLHQPTSSSPTQLWLINLKNGAEQQYLTDKNFQIRSLSLAKQGKEIILLTQPTLARTNEALSVYRYNISESTLTQIELGELGLTLSSLSVSGDGNTLVITTLDGAQYLRTLIGDKAITISKVSNFRGSNRIGTMLIFEDIVPDKNYAGEVVFFDGGVKRITADDATLLMPTISPDGKYVAYSFQLRSAFAEQTVVAGEALRVAFTLPVSGLRRQKVSDQSLEWEHYEPELSFELPKFSPDASIIAVEVFTKAQLQDLSQLREYGEPNKPTLGTLRFFDHNGKLLPAEFAGRELQWVDTLRPGIIK